MALALFEVDAFIGVAAGADVYRPENGITGGEQRFASSGSVVK